MTQIDFKAVNAALDVLNKPRWKWVVDGEDCVFADKDNPPTHELSGHWEYHPPLTETYAMHCDDYSKVKQGLQFLVSGKGCRIPTPVFDPRFKYQDFDDFDADMYIYPKQPDRITVIDPPTEP